MTQPKISIIAAVAEKNRAIGKDNKLLWHISEDLKRFKDLTSGHAIIMGQKTYESIGRLLPNRTNIVISDNSDFRPEGVIVAHSIEESVEKAKKVEKEEIFICGGGMIYRQFMPLADKLYLTLVEGNFSGDVFFPDYSDFKNILSETQSEEGDYKYRFLELIKN